MFGLDARADVSGKNVIADMLVVDADGVNHIDREWTDWSLQGTLRKAFDWEVSEL